MAYLPEMFENPLPLFARYSRPNSEPRRRIVASFRRMRIGLPDLSPSVRAVHPSPPVTSFPSFTAGIATGPSLPARRNLSPLCSPSTPRCDRNHRPFLRPPELVGACPYFLILRYLYFLFLRAPRVSSVPEWSQLKGQRIGGRKRHRPFLFVPSARCFSQ